MSETQLFLTITFLALSHAKYADSEPDSFFIAHFLYNLLQYMCDVKNSRSARVLRQGCCLIF